MGKIFGISNLPVVTIGETIRYRNIVPMPATKKGSKYISGSKLHSAPKNLLNLRKFVQKIKQYYIKEPVKNWLKSNNTLNNPNQKLK